MKPMGTIWNDISATRPYRQYNYMPIE